MKKTDMALLGIAGGAALLILKAGGALPALNVLKNQVQKFTFWNPIRPDQGEPYNPNDPGRFIWSSDLVNGAIKHYFQPSQQIYATPTIQGIVDDVLADAYGTAPKSIIKTGYW